MRIEEYLPRYIGALIHIKTYLEESYTEEYPAIERNASADAYSAAFGDPDLIVACVDGDREAETGRWRPAGMPTNC
jgi:phosphoketolase